MSLYRPRTGDEAAALAPWYRMPMIAARVYCVAIVMIAALLLLWPGL